MGFSSHNSKVAAINTMTYREVRELYKNELPLLNPSPDKSRDLLRTCDISGNFSFYHHMTTITIM
jgi:hypothetical protein